MGQLRGKVAVITGAGSGIGLAATKLFVEEGASVLAVDLNASTLEQVLGTTEGAVSPFVADVTQPFEVAQAISLVDGGESLPGPK